MSKREFDLDNYVKVNDRIAEFREKYPQGRISTFRIRETEGVSFKTVICTDINDAQDFAISGIAPATGHAFLSSKFEGEKMEEMTETTSVGRALANLGIKIEKNIASRDEMERFQKMQQEQSNEENSKDLKELPRLRPASKFNINKINGEK